MRKSLFYAIAAEDESRDCCTLLDWPDSRFCKIWDLRLEERFTPIFIHQLRVKRRGTVNHNWYVDETFIKVRGKHCYLYRTIDSVGNLVDSMLSQKRDMGAGKAFSRQTLELAEEPPE